MAIDNFVKVKRDGTITIFDNAGANTITVDFEGDGNFSFDNGAEHAERVVIMDRGSIVGLRKGNDPVGSISWQVNMREFTNATATGLIDVINHSGSAAAWVSTGGDEFEQYLLDVKITIDGGAVVDSTATFSKVLLTWDFAEGDPNVINISGECYSGITYTGIA